MSPSGTRPQRTGAVAQISARPGSVGLLSTYPPTQCGLASFAATLRTSLIRRSPGTDVGVVRMVDGADLAAGDAVRYELGSDGSGNASAAAAHLNGFSVVVVQHEYGIFGGHDGDQVLDVLNRVRVPVIAVLHTVLSAPTPHQKWVLERLAAAAQAVVTLSATGRLRLCTGYNVDARKVTVIPHGAWPDGPPVATGGASSRPIVLTWGLLGPGKGLEWAVAALAELRVLDPRPLYVVAGQTHPRVLARDGERYRDSLREQAVAAGVADMLRFRPGYLDAAALGMLVASADVVLLPYDSHEQVTSGVLIEAVASLTPVVSTAFPHAREMLGDGAGVLVPHADPAAIAAAIHRVLCAPAAAAAMTAAAARIAPGLEWNAIADRYLHVAGSVLSHRSKVA
jgi:polysaccharide biosynthesis protein PslF